MYIVIIGYMVQCVVNIGNMIHQCESAISLHTVLRTSVSNGGEKFLHLPATQLSVTSDQHCVFGISSLSTRKIILIMVSLIAHTQLSHTIYHRLHHTQLLSIIHRPLLLINSIKTFSITSIYYNIVISLHPPAHRAWFRWCINHHLYFLPFSLGTNSTEYTNHNTLYLIPIRFILRSSIIIAFYLLLQRCSQTM